MGFSQSLLRFSTITGFSLILMACSNTPVQAPDLPEREYYQKAQAALEDGLPSTAIQHLKDLSSRYPFGEFATRAELDLIYAHLSAGNYIEAHVTSERFIKNHPDHPALDYVYYMRGLVTYQSTESFLGRYLALDPSERDAVELTQAFNEFADLLDKYPNSKYAPDAKARMLYLRNVIARHELQVADYYFKRKAPLSALRRGQEVLEHYPSSDAVEQALVVIIRAYLDLGQLDLAQTNLEVLKTNFPTSRFIDTQGRFITPRLPRDAEPDALYWVTLGAVD